MLVNQLEVNVVVAVEGFVSFQEKKQAQDRETKRKKNEYKRKKEQTKKKKETWTSSHFAMSPACSALSAATSCRRFTSSFCRSETRSSFRSVRSSVVRTRVSSRPTLPLQLGVAVVTKLACQDTPPSLTAAPSSTRSTRAVSSGGDTFGRKRCPAAADEDEDEEDEDEDDGAR